MSKKINTFNFKEPTAALEDAIEKLTAFTHPEATRLDVSEDGKLVASQKLNPIDRMIGLAQCYIFPLFSDQAKLDQEKKLKQIKQEILQARDTLKSHASLIEKLKQGDEREKKLAASALDMINHYNAVISQNHSSVASKYDFYNYERHCLLLDSEIKDQAIELPQTFSRKFDSHPSPSVQKTIKDLSAALMIGQNKTFNSTHKKPDQFMIDTFKMKSIRMLQSSPTLLGSKNEMIGLVKHTPIDILEENLDQITMRQMLEYCPGFNILLTGSFRRPGQDNKLMSMPILEDLRLSSEISHSGSPYPAQHTGAAFSGKLTEANPLRSEQVPLFLLFAQRKTKLAYALLHDPIYIDRSRHQFKMTKELFDRQRQDFLTLQKDFHLLLIQERGNTRPEAIQDLNAFFDYLARAPSPFMVLSQAQQRINDFFIKDPSHKLEEEWLTAGTPLRNGNPQEKYQFTKLILQESRNEAFKSSHQPIDNYVKTMGDILGQASQAIILQYFSEKIGYAPPMLSDFERKLQACAFRQTEWLINEYDNPVNLDEKHFTEHLKSKCRTDIKILESTTIDDLNLNAALLTNSLEIYFNSRWKHN